MVVYCFKYMYNKTMSKDVETRIRRRLREATEQEKLKKKRAFSPLLPYKKELATALKSGVSFRQLVSVLKAEGVHVSRHRLQAFCNEILKKESKRQRVNTNRSKPQHTGTLKTTRPQTASPQTNTPKANPKFRIARDDV